MNSNIDMHQIVKRLDKKFGQNCYVIAGSLAIALQYSDFRKANDIDIIVKHFKMYDDSNPMPYTFGQVYKQPFVTDVKIGKIDIMTIENWQAIQKHYANDFGCYLQEPVQIYEIWQQAIQLNITTSVQKRIDDICTLFNMGEIYRERLWLDLTDYGSIPIEVKTYLESKQYIENDV